MLTHNMRLQLPALYFTHTVIHLLVSLCSLSNAHCFCKRIILLFTLALSCRMLKLCVSC